MKLTTHLHLVSSLSERNYTFTSPACLRGVGRDDFTFLPVTGYQLATPSEVRVASNIVERRRVTSFEIQKLFLSVFDLVFLPVGAPSSIMTACSLNWKQTGFSTVLLLKGNVCLVTETISSPRLSVKETLVVMSIPRNKWTGVFQSV